MQSDRAAGAAGPGRASAKDRNPAAQTQSAAAAVVQPSEEPSMRTPKSQRKKERLRAMPSQTASARPAAQSPSVSRSFVDRLKDFNNSAEAKGAIKMARLGVGAAGRNRRPGRAAAMPGGVAGGAGAEVLAGDVRVDADDIDEELYVKDHGGMQSVVRSSAGPLPATQQVRNSRGANGGGVTRFVESKATGGFSRAGRAARAPANGNNGEVKVRVGAAGGGQQARVQPVHSAAEMRAETVEELRRGVKILMKTLYSALVMATGMLGGILTTELILYSLSSSDEEFLSFYPLFATHYSVLESVLAHICFLIPLAFALKVLSRRGGWATLPRDAQARLLILVGGYFIVLLCAQISVPTVNKMSYEQQQDSSWYADAGKRGQVDVDAWAALMLVRFACAVFCWYAAVSEAGYLLKILYKPAKSQEAGKSALTGW